MIFVSFKIVKNFFYLIGENKDKLFEDLLENICIVFIGF